MSILATPPGIPIFNTAGAGVTVDYSGRTIFPPPGQPARAMLGTTFTGEAEFFLAVESVTFDSAIGLGFNMHVSLSSHPPVLADDPIDPNVPDIGDIVERLELTRRLVPQVSVDMPTPIITRGKPVLPLYVASYGSDITLIEGPDHIHAIPDPDPIWDPATSGWFIQPPASGVGDSWWSVDSLPDPAGFPNQFYWLGDPSSLDGTIGIAAACQQWAPSAPSGGPSWRSIYPYKPSVRQHVYYGSDGSIQTVTKGVRFNIQFIEHMWADFGSLEGDPFTWVIVGIIMDFPSSGYVHSILDVGRNPISGGAPVLNENQLQGSHALAEDIQSPYRPGISVSATEQRNWANWTHSQSLITPFNHTTRPKMWFGVWNRGASKAGSYSTAGKYLKGGTLPAVGTRYALLGRQAGVLSRNNASHVVLFEMRYWRSALTEQQLDEQYHQLSSTWKFGAYH